MLLRRAAAAVGVAPRALVHASYLEACDCATPRLLRNAAFWAFLLVAEVQRLLQESAKPFDESDGSGLPRYGQAVPLGWFKFQALAKKLVIRDGQRRMTLTEAQELAETCGVSSEAECSRMLQEFSDLGQIIWHDTAGARELVVLDVQWFMDRMTDVLCHRSIKKHRSEAASKGMRRLWNNLAVGRLSPRLLPVLWPELSETERRSMLASMAMFGFVSRLSEQAVEEADWPYIVPSLLPAVPQDRAVWVPSEEHDRSLIIRFIHRETQEWTDKHGFLPDTLFFRVVSALIQDATSISDAFQDLYLDRMVVRGDQRFMIRHLRQQQGRHFRQPRQARQHRCRQLLQRRRWLRQCWRLLR